MVKKHMSELKQGQIAKHMKIRLRKKTEKYYIHSLELSHNHALHVSQCAQIMPSQMRVSQAQALEINLADDSSIKLKDLWVYG